MPAQLLAPPPGSRQERNASDYKELMALVKTEGLLERRRGWYVARAALLLVLFAGATALLLTLGSSPWQLAVAALFGVLFTQAAFFCHDAAHRQVFASNKRNEWLSRIIGDSVVGLSYGWWMNKHTRHHANPNKLGKDGDIAPGALVFTAQDAAQRTGRAAWWMARQHWFFFPILLLAGLDLHVNAIKGVLGAAPMKHRVVEGILLVVRLGGFAALVMIVCGPLMGLAFLAIQIAVFGFHMGGSFAPNHKGMTILPHDADVDFLRRQTLTSRNISGGLPVATLMGGLNYQIEHHLFPNMPSVNLARARVIVRRFCAERGVDYTETTLVGSYRIVVGYLKRVGLRYADPFECPVSARFR